MSHHKCDGGIFCRQCRREWEELIAESKRRYWIAEGRKQVYYELLEQERGRGFFARLFGW
jgi:hypothetical protein